MREGSGVQGGNEEQREVGAAMWLGNRDCEHLRCCFGFLPFAGWLIAVHLGMRTPP